MTKKNKLMAKFNQGILGAFSGKIGTVVGSNWKGISYMRVQASHVHNPKSAAQLDQRSKFSLTMHTLQPLKGYIRTGFKEYAIKKSSYNAAFSYTIKNAITGEYPEYQVDHSLLMVARGGLTGVDVASATATDGKISFTWNDNSGLGSAKSTDVAMPLVYNPVKRLCIFGTSPASRIEGSTDIAVPTSWIGDAVVLYMAFQSVDGTEVSDSTYLGEAVIV